MSNKVTPLDLHGRPLPIEVPNKFYGACTSVKVFEKLNRLGEGTYGVVYRARDRRNGRIVALKRTRSDSNDACDSNSLYNFRELMILQRLHHKNVVNVLDVAVGDRLDMVFMVMEYCEQDMGTLLDNMPKKFSLPDVKCLMKQLLRGLEYLHHNHVIHRDLKMSNLLLTTEGTLKIADFGLARPYHSSMQPMTPSVVTLWYRAPELLFGAKEYTTSIDTWSAGCIFGELLLGRPLMPGRTEMQQICLIIDVLGTPNDKIWPEFRSLPLAKKFTLPSQAYNNLRLNLPKVSSNTIELINGFLTYDPRRRLSARRALYHPYFDEPPLAQDPSMLPTFPEVRNMTTSEMARLRMQINKETRGANNLT